MTRDWFDINDMDQYRESYPRFFELTGCTLDTRLADLKNATNYVIHRHFDPRLIKDKDCDKTSKTKLDPTFDFWSHHYKLMTSLNEDITEKGTTMNTAQLNERQEYLEIVAQACSAFRRTLRPKHNADCRGEVYDKQEFEEQLERIVKLKTGCSPNSTEYKQFRQDLLDVLKTDINYQLVDIQKQKSQKALEFAMAVEPILTQDNYDGALDLHRRLKLRGVEHYFQAVNMTATLDPSKYKITEVSTGPGPAPNTQMPLDIKNPEYLVSLYKCVRVEYVGSDGGEYFGFLDYYYQDHEGSDQVDGIAFWIGSFTPSFIE